MYCDALVKTQIVHVGVVGLGYWGPNLARNFDALPGCELAWCCDGRPRPGSASSRSSRTRASPSELEDLLADPRLDAVVVATPVPTHAELAIRVLEAGKHCFVEKPLALTVADAERVLAAQRASGRTLMVGHLLEYHPGVRQLKQIVDSGELGAGPLHLLQSPEPRASSGPTRTRCGASAPTTSRWCFTSRARSRTSWRRTARATSGPASRTSCSASCGSPRA